MIDNFFCFPVSNDVVIYSSVMMFRRHHPLLWTMNEKIRAISESGLLSKWEKENTLVGNEEEGSKDGSSGGGKQMKLRLDHVQGAFILLCIGLGIAGLSFLSELIASRSAYEISVRYPSNTFFRTVEEFFCFA